MFDGYNSILLIAVKRAINKTRIFRLCDLISKMQSENVGNVANSYFIRIHKKKNTIQLFLTARQP